MTIAILSVALIGAVAAFAVYFVKLDDANDRIEQQRREIQEQNDLLDEKETFNAEMQSLVETAGSLDGLPFAAAVPFESYESLASLAWLDRRDAQSVARLTAKVQAARGELEELLAAAGAQASSNATGTTNESVIDQLGRGYVASVVDAADAYCQEDVLACVASEDPYTVHFDIVDGSAEYMNDWLRTGLAYHEFAHVLQFTNPEPTKTAVQAFGGDVETMADCYALTFLDGWTLDHRVWVSDYEYYDVSMGYGYTCDESQRQVIRDWNSQLGFHLRPISQGS